MKNGEGVITKEGVIAAQGITVKEGIQIASIGVIGDILCAPLTFSSTFTTGFTQDPVVNEIITGISTNVGYQSFLESDQEVLIADNKLWVEFTVNDSPVALQAGSGVHIGGEGVIYLRGTGVDGGLFVYSTLFGALTFVPGFSGLDSNLPKTFQLRFDGDTGDVHVTDGVTLALVGNVAGLGDIPRKVEYSIFGNNQVGDTYDIKVNTGYESASIDPGVFQSYCNFPPPPPSVDPIESTGAFGVFAPNPDLNITQDGNNYTIENISNPVDIEAWLRQSRYHYCSLPGDQLFVEMTIHSFSNWSTDLFLQGTFYQGFFGSLDGIAMFPDVDGLGNGLIVDANASVLWSGAVSLPWTVQLRMDFNGAITIEHTENLGISIPVQSFGGDIFHDQQVMFFHQAQLPAIANASMNFTINNGETTTVINLPAGYTDAASKTKYLAAYRAFDFSSEGNTVIEAPFVGDSIFGHGIRLTKNAGDVPPPDVEAPEFTGSIGSAGLTAILDFPKVLYEIYCSERDADMADKILRLAANAVFNVQAELCYSDGFTGADGVDGTPEAWAFRSFSGIGSTKSLIPLFNNRSYEVGDAIAAYYDNGDAVDKISVGFILNIAGERIVYDAWGSLDPSAGLTFTPIFETKTNTNVPNGDTAKFIFNGADADYAFTTYPDIGLKDIQGVALVTAVDPYTREALLVPYTWRNETIGSAIVDVTRKILSLDATGVPAVLEAYAHSPLAIRKNTGGYLIEMEITTVNASQTDAYFLELRSPNSKEVIAVRSFGGDLVLETTAEAPGLLTQRDTISVGYSPQSGDRFAIFIVTDDTGAPGSPVGVYGLFQRGVNPVEASAKSTFMYEQDDLYLDHFVFIGHASLPMGETTVITSKFKSADISADFKTFVSSNTPIGVTVTDLEGGSL